MSSAYQVIDISPGNLDSSLCFIQPGILHDYSAYKLNKQGDNITERYMWGIWLLAAQKSVNRQGWWKEKFALFQMLATGAGGVVVVADICPKANCPL